MCCLRHCNKAKKKDAFKFNNFRASFFGSVWFENDSNECRLGFSIYVELFSPCLNAPIKSIQCVRIKKQLATAVQRKTYAFFRVYYNGEYFKLPPAMIIVKR